MSPFARLARVAAGPPAGAEPPSVALELDPLPPMSPSPLKLVVVSLLVLLAGCGNELPAAPAVQKGTSPLEAAFTDAAREFQVPVELLKAIAYVETRVSPATGGSVNGGHGLMNLVEGDDWKMLSRAAALTGVDAARLKLDPVANIRGAAAVLRELGDKSFRTYPELSAHNLGDWFQAVSLYPGIDSAPVANDYAADTFVRLEQGFEVPSLNGTVVLEPIVADWRKHSAVASRRDALGDYPNIAQYKQSPHYSVGRTSYQYVLIHTMQGSYSGCISWFQNPTSKVSSHYQVRSSDGQITQMVTHANTAWHAQCYNGKSVGIEHEGYVANPGQWYTDAMYTESAKLTRWIADRHGIPKDRAHIIGHNEVSSACNTGGHTDPGSGWNWSKYMGLVLGSTPTTPGTGVFIGAIYTGGSSTNRVSGAVVTVNGQSVTTGVDGIYQFTLPAGSHTASVSKAGFGTNTAVRTIVAGAQVWGSMEINAVATTGTLRGKVFAYNAANPADMSVAITGAVVTTAGQSVTTAADGNYAFTLPPGNYTVSVAKAGYSANSVARTVTGSTVTWGSVGLTGTSGPDQQAPQVAISYPADKASLDLAVFNLTGTASDNAGAVASVQLSINGGAAATVPVTAGAFSIEVKLKPGTTPLKITGKDAAGNLASATHTASFNAGVSGFIHVSEDEAQRVTGALVQLREVGTGTVVSSATTDATGAFSLATSAVPVDHVLFVKATGFMTYSETLTIPDDQRLTKKVGLNVGNDVNPTDVGVTFTDPLEGSTVTTQSVTVYGTAKGFEVASVKVNGVQAELLGAGGFTATVPVVEGENTLEAIATGLGGESALGKLKIIRKLGSNSVTQPKPDPSQMVARGGCASVGGLELLGLGLLGALLRRRRS
ncbi:MAG: amidase [Myxococcaceae bacterium]|nr:amidase [Myxococcaceae bacterium]